MIPEREREALMRLTMCAREECGMCKYKETCNFDFQYETATRCMNILADALNADRKIEPTISKMEQVDDDPQTDCNGCKFVGTYDTEFPCANCSRKTKDYYAKDEPQRDCESCKYFGHDEIEACGYCRHKDLYEPQTERKE